MNMAIKEKGRALKGMKKVIPRHNKMARGSKITGGAMLVRMLWPIKMPMIVAHSAGTRGRENISSFLTKSNTFHAKSWNQGEITSNRGPDNPYQDDILLRSLSDLSLPDQLGQGRHLPSNQWP